MFHSAYYGALEIVFIVIIASDLLSLFTVELSLLRVCDLVVNFILSIYLLHLDDGCKHSSCIRYWVGHRGYCLGLLSTRRCDHISPVLYQLHWLPVQQCIAFKIATLVHRSLSGNAPGYLADDCLLVADARVRQLRSANTRTLVVSQTRSSFGDGTFAAAGQLVWSSLPPNLRLCGLSHGQFRRLLKTFLFGQCGNSAVRTVF